MYLCPLSLSLDDTRYSIVPDYFLNLRLVSPASCFLCLPQGVSPSGRLYVINTWWLDFLAPPKNNLQVQNTKAELLTRKASFSHFQPRGGKATLDGLFFCLFVFPLALVKRDSQFSITIVLTKEPKICLEFKNHPMPILCGENSTTKFLKFHCSETQGLSRITTPAACASRHRSVLATLVHVYSCVTFIPEYLCSPSEWQGEALMKQDWGTQW